MISLDEYQCENEEKFQIKFLPDKISYICKVNRILYINENCQTKTVSPIITKSTWIRVKIAKICNIIFKLNRNWRLKL